MSEKLKPCPFCGSKAYLIVNKKNGKAVALCRKCPTETNIFPNIRKAVEAWNNGLINRTRG